MKLHYLLDTDICIYIAKESPASVLKKFEQLEMGEVGMSLITYGELFYGAQKSHHAQKNLVILEKLINLIVPQILPLHTGDHYGKVRSKLEKEGLPIGNNDLWIVAHALALNITLVTNNTREFSRVPDLKLENWVDI